MQRAVEIVDHRHAFTHGESWIRHAASSPKPRGGCITFPVTLRHLHEGNVSYRTRPNRSIRIPHRKHAVPSGRRAALKRLCPRDARSS